MLANGQQGVYSFYTLLLFSNFDPYDEPLAKPNTLLIDSQQIESSELDKNLRDMAAVEIETFKRERKQRGEHDEISDSELLREVRTCARRTRATATSMAW